MATKEDSPPTSPIVTFVVIARNEEKSVGECLDSIMRAGKRLPLTETVFVDSKSTDATLEIASRFPITVIRLGADQTPSPAAGRAVGSLFAHGKYIFYVDGDMILDDSWLPDVIDFMDSNPSFGAVFGGLTDRMNCLGAAGDKNHKSRQFEVNGYQVSISPVERLAGSAIIRRTVIDRVGGFNPYLPGDEEAELSYRITSSGLRIGVSNTVMAFHPRRKVSTLSEIVRRSKYGYFRGQGLVLKMAYRQGRKAFLHHLWRLKLYVLHGAWIIIGFLTIAMSAMTGSCSPTITWGVISLGGMAIQIARFGARDATRRLFSSTLVGVGVFCALFRRVPESHNLPGSFERIK